MHYSTNFIKKLETEISTQSDKRKPKPNVIVKPSLLCSGTVRCRGGEMNTHIIVTFYTFSYTNSYSYNAINHIHRFRNHMSVCVCCVMGMLCGTLRTDEYIIPLTFAKKLETESEKRNSKPNV